MRQVMSRTFDALSPSAFLPYMLFRIFISSARRLRPSAGTLSPAILFAVVLGLVSESCLHVSVDAYNAPVENASYSVVWGIYIVLRLSC